MEAIHRLLDGCQPLTEEEANEIVNRLTVKFDELGINFSPIGSFNKKKEGEMYNDIDIAVEAPYENGFDIVKYVASGFEDISKLGKFNDKFNTISIGWKINDERNAQVDFMFTDNLEFAKFAFHSPNFKNGESKYKGMYASILLQSTIRNIPLEREHFEDGSLKEWTYYSLSQKDGLLLKHKTFIGKKGGRIKSPRLVEEKFITKNVEEIMVLTFKDVEAIRYVWIFEKLLDYICIKYDRQFIERVKHDFLTDWEFELKTPDELKKEFEDLFNQKINSL